MEKCEKCGATIVFGARTFAGRTFCSNECIVRSINEDPSVAPSARPRSPLAPALATAHSLLLLSLYGALWFVRGLDITTTYLLIALFWPWPLWLWPVIRYRHQCPLGFAVALAISFIAWLAATPMMFVLTLFMSPSSHVKL